MRHFTLKEFDSPDLPGSGAHMNDQFLELLDKAREDSGIVYKITSGFRTPEHNRSLKKRGYQVATHSSHLKGLAADIAVTSSANRLIIIESLLYVGFRRLGIGYNFIHVDLDSAKVQDLIWTY